MLYSYSGGGLADGPASPSSTTLSASRHLLPFSGSTPYTTNFRGPGRLCEPQLAPQRAVFCDVARRRVSGAPIEALHRLQERYALRSWFPEAGDSVEVHSAQRWRAGVVKAVHRTRSVGIVESEFLYDIQLTNDGLWTPDEVLQYKKLFNRADVDSSGEITSEELVDLLIAFKHPDAYDDEAIRAMFKRVDADGSGVLGFEQFVGLIYVELKDVIGIETSLLSQHSNKLRRLPGPLCPKTNFLSLQAQPFAAIVRRERRGKHSHFAETREKRLDAMAGPVQHRSRAKAPPGQERPVVASFHGARNRLATNVFDPANYDRFSRATVRSRAAAFDDTDLQEDDL
mmetsp:Transcript_34083/g.117342  ORF Transcript_34083/g.117342 Transcript_34083/m.117342 type:complete len:342 (+) Transcript_34083:118-1143(+)